MANKKISELQSRTPALSDLMLVGDPSSGYSYKCTVTALATIIETDIADGYVTIGTTQTISGAKTFSNNLTLTSVANATTTQTKFLTLNASNVVNYRTGAEVLADIGGASSSSISGTTNYVAKFTSSSAIGNSQIFDNGTNVGIGTNTPTRTLDVNGIITTNNNLELTSSTPTILWTTSNLRFYNNTNGIVATISSAGQLTLSSIPNATIDTDRFLVSDSGVIKYRTGAEVLSDIGGQAALTNPVTGTGTTNYVTKWTSSSAIGNSQIIDNGTAVGIGTAPSNAYLLSVAGIYRGVGVGNAARIELYDTQSGGATFFVNPQQSLGVTSLGTYGAYPISFVTNNSEQMRLDASGNLGLGTSSPGANFEIVGGSGGSDWVRLTRTGVIQWAFNSNNGNLNIANNTASTVPLVLTTSGNLGLGVTPSAWDALYFKPFEIGNSSSRMFVTGRTDTEISGQIGLNAYYQSGWKYTNTGASSMIYFEGAKMVFRNAASGTGGAALTWTDAMTLDASGRLGIGTTSPAGILQIKAGNPAVYVTSDDTGQSHIYFGGTTDSDAGRITYSDNADAMWFSTDNTERMRITSGGDVLVATTTASFPGAGRGNITIGGSSSSILSFQTGGTDKGYLYHDATNLNLNNFISGALLFGTNNSERMRITSGGSVGIGTSTFNYTSATRGQLALNGATDVVMDFQVGTTSYGYIYAASTGFEMTNPTNNPLKFITNNVERMRITSGGDVGIGTTTINNKLEVNGNVNVQSTNFYRYNGDTGLIGSGTSITGGTASQLGIRAASDILFATNGANERMRITSGGNVGIGTTSPTGTGWNANSLAVQAYKNDTDGALFRATSSNTDFVFSAGNDLAYIATLGADPIAFYTDLTERMRITSGGSVLIGTTTDNGRKLQVNGPGTFTGTGFDSQSAEIQLINTTATTGKTFVLNATNSGGFQVADKTAGGATRFFIDTSGNSEFSGSIKTAAPSGGTAKPWKLGEAGVTLGGSNTSGVRVEIDGVVYYLVTGYLP